MRTGERERSMSNNARDQNWVMENAVDITQDRHLRCAGRKYRHDGIFEKAHHTLYLMLSLNCTMRLHMSQEFRQHVHGLLTKTKPTAGVDTVTTSRGAA